MHVFQSVYQDGAWQTPLPEASSAHLVFVFGISELAKCAEIQATINASFPRSEIVGCTTSGEIHSIEIYDFSLCLTAITLEDTPLLVKSNNIESYQNSEQAGLSLAATLSLDGLKHVLVFADGQKVNGTALVNGLRKALPESVSITGGLAADGERFQETWAWHNGRVESGRIILCGFYGNSIRIGHGCVGGWDAFGPDRLVTRAKNNILYELDGRSALKLYKDYLGEHAKDLPGSALLFPLNIHAKGDSQGVVRTILNINEDDQSMVFAGDIEEGKYARLMHASYDRLVDGAGDAAKNALSVLGESPPELALLISCVGRRLVLKQHAEEELEIVQDTLGDSIPLCGFYSHGEISQATMDTPCTLHNQTMTITLFSEVINA